MPDVSPSASDAPTIAAAAGVHPSMRGIEGPLRPGDAFGARYRILRVLGAGGMGVVYHAWDDELGVALALKVIKPEVMASPEAARDVERRFKRELLLARQVTHRNVVRIHDLGEIDGIKYLTMPFVEGRNLAAIIREAGTLPVPRALRIAKQIATGLQAAHEAGVVHRDLKPENIMVDEDDQALIMDFGISRSLSGTGAGTMMGAVVGTLEYMSPEQGRGQPADQRADIYAFGLMLYDMLAGRKRLDSAESAVAEMMSRMTQPPPKLGTFVGHLPPDLEAIVARCVEPDPDRRYASTAALVADLEALGPDGRRPAAARRPASRWRAVIVGTAALGALTLGAAGGWWWSGSRPGSGTVAPAAREPVSLLVADFDNRAGDPVFDGALEQALAIAMEGSPLVSAFPQRTARALAAELTPGWDGRLTEEVGTIIAHREGLKVLLAGSIEKAGGGYRLTIRATDPGANGREIARRSRDVASKGDVLQAVGTLAEQIRRELGESSTDMERLAAAETFTAGSIEAMRAYARGQELLNAGKYQEALAAFQEAVKHDPEMGRAYSAMGAIYANLKQTSRAEAAFQEALKHIDRMSDREKYRTRATYYIGAVGNYEKAIENYEALLKMFPADASYGNLAFAYLRTGNIAQAQNVASRGLAIYPKNLLQRTNYAAYSVYAGDFATGAREAETVIAANARYEFAYLPLALARVGEGNLDAARAAYDTLAGVSDTGRSLAALGRADIAMYRGQPEAAIAELRTGIALDEKLESPGELAAKHVALAEASLARNNRPAAVAAAKRAVSAAGLVNVVVPAARVFIAAGDEAAARAIAKDLENRLQNETAAYARVILAEIALNHRQFPEARELLRDSLKRQDTWLAHFLLGRAYFESNSPVEAQDEWELCQKRRGEVLDMFFADSPTARHLPVLAYWLGRAREQTGNKTSAAAFFGEYIKMRGGATDDPLVTDASRRLAALK